MKITIYELLEMIKDDKAPKKIKYNNDIYEYEDCDYFDINRGYLFDRYNVSGILNDEVEILEEEKKIPEKFKINYEIDEENTINMEKATMLECDLACKINEIIDYLDYLKSKGE